MNYILNYYRLLAFKLIASLAAIVFSAGALAQTAVLPSAPIRLIVPSAPGASGMDQIARTIGPKLSERIGRPVVVVNLVGASGNIGTEAVVRAAPNGSTLLMTVSTLVMSASLYPQLTFDPAKDLTPVSLTSWGQLLLLANPKAGFKTAADLVDAARKTPGRINYGSPGVGTPHHLSMEMLKTTAGVSMTHIPYRTTGQVLTDLIGGQIEAMFLPIHVALPYVKSGKLVALGISSDKRHPLLPLVPTMAEAKVGTLNLDMWYGIFAPRGISTDLVALFNREINAILLMDEVKNAFQSQGMDPSTNSTSPAEFRRLVDKDAERWTQLIKKQNLSAD